MGAMDWGHSSLGRLLGSEYQVIYFFSALTWMVFLIVHLFSIPETPLAKDISLDVMTPNALLLLSTHSSSGGYGSLHGSMSQESEADLRPRSFSALGEANSVTSSAKQPNKEVCQRHTMKSSLADLLYEILTLIPILCFTGNKTKRSVYETTHTNGMSNPLKHISVKWHQCLLRRM